MNNQNSIQVEEVNGSTEQYINDNMSMEADFENEVKDNALANKEIIM